jgi:hypothetical protein
MEVSMRDSKAATSPIPGKAEPAAIKPDEKRRRFLRTLGVGGAGAAVAGVTAAAGTVTPVETKSEQSKSSGYRETQHVRDYYRSAKF